MTDVEYGFVSSEAEVDVSSLPQILLCPALPSSADKTSSATPGHFVGSPRICGCAVSASAFR